MARTREGAVIRRVAVLGAVLVAVFVYGVGGYMMMGFSFVDAFYMAALALTTAGFNPIGDLDQGAKVFTISIAVLGVSVFLAALATIMEIVSEGQFLKRSRRRRMDRRIKALKDHFIVCAYGRVGRTVARELEAESVPFVVLDDLEELHPIMEQDGVLHIVADPTQEQTLRDAGIERARGLVCAMDSDAANVYITLTAHSMNPKLFIVARAAEASGADKLYRAGANRVVSPYVTSGRHMALIATRPRVVDYLEMGVHDELGLRLEEVVVEEDSPLIGKRLGDALGDAMCLALRRVSGRLIHNPDADLSVAQGDLLLLMGTEDTLRPLEGD